MYHMIVKTSYVLQIDRNVSDRYPICVQVELIPFLCGGDTKFPELVLNVSASAQRVRRDLYFSNLFYFLINIYSLYG
jgi:hypothetical protein